MDLSRYGVLLRTSHVWLLAPTWIAVNASIGLWFSQSIFQFSQADPQFPDQFLHAAASRASRSRSAAVVIGILFGPGCCTGATGSRTCGGRRSSCTGSSAAALLVGGGHRGQPRRRAADRRADRRGGASPRFGLFVLAGATPAALGLLADISERFPTDRGAIMGLYCVFLAVGQIVGQPDRRVRGRRGAASTGC